MYKFWEKKLEWKNFYEKKNLSKKNLLENNFCQKKFCKKKILLEKYLSEKNLVGKTIFVRKKIIGKKLSKYFLSESSGCDEHDLSCIFVYQMGRLYGGAHEISDIKAQLFLHGWLVCW